MNFCDKCNTEYEESVQDHLELHRMARQWIALMNMAKEMGFLVMMGKG